MLDLPARHFDTWTLDEVRASCGDEPMRVMPGSGRRVLGPRRKLLEAMHKAGVRTAGELDGPVRERHLFALTIWTG